MNENELLTITETAALTRTPVATLRYWRHLGVGPRSFRLRRRVVYRLSDVEGWIRHQQDEEDARRVQPARGRQR